VVRWTPPWCACCGQPQSPWRPAADVCPRCRRISGALPVRVVGPYEGRLRDVLHTFKYDGRRSLAPRLGELMKVRGAVVLAGAEIVVPVPLHPSRRRERGFDQAADLARHVGLPVVRALGRIRPTAVQASLPAGRRHANVRDAFALAPAATRLRGRVVVLVDDVSTTGATLEACARALSAAGPREIRALTAARVVSTRR